MTTQRPPILDESDLAAIRTALELCEQHAEDILRAKQAGLNVAEFEKTIDECRTRLLAYKRTYFPNVI